MLSWVKLFYRRWPCAKVHSGLITITWILRSSNVSNATSQMAQVDMMLSWSVVEYSSSSVTPWMFCIQWMVDTAQRIIMKWPARFKRHCRRKYLQFDSKIEISWTTHVITNKCWLLSFRSIICAGQKLHGKTLYATFTTADVDGWPMSEAVSLSSHSIAPDCAMSSTATGRISNEEKHYRPNHRLISIQCQKLFLKTKDFREMKTF